MEKKEKKTLYIYIYIRGALTVSVIVVENRIGDQSLNPGRGTNALWKAMQCQILIEEMIVKSQICNIKEI